MNSDKSPLSTILARIQTWINWVGRAWLEESRGKRIAKKTAWIGGITLTILLVVWIALRGFLLNWAFDKAVAKLDRKGYTLQCEDKGFTYLLGVQLRGLSLTHKKHIDTPRQNLVCLQRAGRWIECLEVLGYWFIGL